MAIAEISDEIWTEFRKKPSIETRNIILMHYLKIVKEIAMRITPVYKNHFEYDDLYSFGIFGLMDAIEKFDVKKGIKFATYATWRIKGSIIDQIREQDWLPKSMRQKFKSIEDAYREIEKLTGEYPSDEEVAQYLHMKVSDVNRILNDSYYYQIISMDEEITEFAFHNSATDQQIPEEQYLNNELKQALLDTIDKLTENEKMVISLYYYNELNQKEIGRVMGLTESRISQLHSRALLKLGVSIKKNNLVQA